MVVKWGCRVGEGGRHWQRKNVIEMGKKMVGTARGKRKKEGREDRNGAV